jgi:hypothetical protein
MGSIVIYSFIFYENPTDNGVDFPRSAHIVGWCITASGLIWLPVVIVWKVMTQEEKGFVEVCDEILNLLKILNV